jgi:hypothetical protein
VENHRTLNHPQQVTCSSRDLLGWFRVPWFWS